MGKARLRKAIVTAPSGGRSAAEIERYLSDRHLNEIIAWVRQHERTNPRPKSKPHDLAGRLRALATAVPVQGERLPAVRDVARALVRSFPLPPELALTLLECWNERRCSPPLPRDHVQAIFNRLALREAHRVKARHVRR
jgi:hypothetical protein